jgi:hypothetical protein
MNVLVGCEFSGVIRDAFIALGHNAMSCDLLPTSRPGPHYQGDIRDILADARQWDLLIACPPCTYLCRSGVHWVARIPGRAQQMEDAIAFVRSIANANVDRYGIENPIGVLSTRWRKPDQIIQPHQFGHDAAKATCLWTKNIPKLVPTQHVSPRWVCCGRVLDIDLVGKYDCPNCNGDGKPLPRWANQTDSGQNRLGPSADRWALRSITYPGIAAAMASQWGGQVSPGRRSRKGVKDLPR